MTDIPDDLARKLEENEKNMKAQQAAIIAQQETINTMKSMLDQVLRKKKKTEGSGHKPRSRKKKEMKPTPETSEAEREAHISSEASPESSGETSFSDSHPHRKRFDDFQNQLDALKVQKDLAEQGVVRPYPIEWDSVPYPPKFKLTSLTSFDGKGSPTQHIYYFLSQT